MQVFVCKALGDLGLELAGWFIAFQVLIVLQVAYSYLAEVIVDIFAGLLTANTKGIAQVAGSEPAFP